MKMEYDWSKTRTSLQQTGVIVFGGGIAHGVLQQGDLKSAFTMVAFGVILIAFSGFKRREKK